MALSPLLPALLEHPGNISARKVLSLSVPERDRQFRVVRVHHEHREEPGWLRLAGIGADGVAVAGQLGEALSRLVGRHRSVVDLAAPLKTVAHKPPSVRDESS